MQKFSFLLIALIITSAIIGQQWTDNLPQGKLQNGDLTFYEIQKAFNDFWEPLNVDKNGYYSVNGEKIKAQGWKQFRRWEYYWENRIVKETGQFPKTSASEELEKYLLENPGGKSANGNWTNLGPTNTSGGYAGLGRLNCVGFVAGDNNTIYVGSPSGGIWKTSNGGTSWTPIGDYNAVLGVSDIVAYRPPSLPEVIYIATGDRDGGSMWSLGGGQYNDNNSVGVLKSTDGGTTWNTTGLSFTASQLRTVNRLLLHPSDNNILYAATSVGVYKTINGGTTWSLLSATEFIDMEFNPATPSTIYGSTKAGDIYRSTDNGAIWTATLTTAEYRTELAVSANNSSIVYAVLANSSNGLAGIYKSTDSGASFSQIFSGATTNMLNWDCSSTASGGQGWYDLCIAADPTNVNNVFVGGVNTWKSTNGGTAWTITNHWTSSYGCGVSEVHADQHCLAYQNGTSTLFEGNDGGVYKTTNNGSSWTHLGSGLIISQIYRLGVAQTVTNENIIGLQDNGTKAFLSGSWSDVIGGDGMDCAIDYTNQNTMYGETQNGGMRRSTNHGGTWSLITSGLSGTPYWCTPFTIDPIVNTTVYIGYQDVFKSTNQGTSWTKISTWAGSTLKSLTVAPSNSSYIYTATSSILYRTTNGGTSWSNITGTIPTGSGNITSICVKNDDPNTVWVSLGGYNATRVYQTVNGGTSWTNISTGLPSIPVMCVIQNKQNTSQVELYAGTDVGVYVKSGSANWTMFSTGLPNVVVAELEIHYTTPTANSRIRAATFGRGLWQSDLLSSATTPPVANFVASNTSPAVGSQIDFSDLSSNTPTSWSWSFSPSTITYLGGTTSTSQNPQVQFNAIGSYTVILTASNAYGSDAETKTNYINVINCTFNTLPFTENFPGTTLPTCWSQVDNQGNGQIWQFGTITSVSPNPALTGNYAYLNSDAYGSGNSQNADLITPTLNLSGYSSVNLNFQHSYYHYTGSSATLSYSINGGSSWTTIQTWATASTSNPATFSQVIAAVAGQSNVKFKWRYVGTWGWYWAVDDLNITGTPVTLPPTAAFSASTTTPYIGQTVTFTDLSTNSPTSWAWSFTPSTVTYVGGTSSTSQNPQVQFNAGGLYSVTLTATNAGGSDPETKNNYISVFYAPVANFSANITIPAIGQTVTFTDLSTNAPDSWAWSFSPATVTYVVGSTSTSQNPQVQFTAGGLYSVTLTVTNASGSDQEIKTDYIDVHNPIINLDITVYLEGPFNGSGMTTNLNGILPLSQPYNILPWFYTGIENVSAIPDANIIDWVLVELRDATDAASAHSGTMMDRQAAFLLNNGKIVGMDGTSYLQFNNSLIHQLYVVIWHRNHLGIMSSNSLSESGGVYSFDFTTGAGQVYGSASGHKEIVPGIWGMFGGDGNRDGEVTSTDKSPLWDTQSGTQGYLDSDYNLDTQSDNKDKDNIWAPNSGMGSMVPN